MTARVVIVGSGQAGAQVAISLRQLGFAGEVVLAGEESEPPYQRPPLSKAYMSGEMPLERTYIRAPVDGVIVQRAVHVGQRVQSGASLMSIVPIGEAYVDANFKEMQLTKVREGQEVELTSDLYGSDVVFHGRVIGLAGGTGSAFALIPAQNATGNWIKVVQRVPVRIAIDREDLLKHPLRVGLSMEATINTGR